MKAVETNKVKKILFKRFRFTELLKIFELTIVPKRLTLKLLDDVLTEKYSLFLVNIFAGRHL